MKKLLLVTILILSFVMTGCGNKNNIKEINAESFTISYGKSIYEAKDKVEQEIVDSLVAKYSNLKLNGTTNQEINYDKAITIIFLDNDKISGKVTVDDKGICKIEDNPDNYIIDEESNIYVDALKIYNDLKRKY